MVSYLLGSIAAACGASLTPTATVGSAITGASTLSFSARRLLSVRNSILTTKSISACGSGSWTSRSSMVKSSTISHSNCTKRLDISICARLSCKLSRRLGCLISPARSNSSSKDPYSLISKAAVSELMMVQLPPASRARQANVAIMSSASKPATSLHATLKARVASRVSGNCGIKSSGVGARFALYLSYISLRKVLPE